jgi:predicted alpha/beta-fold hydrolase
VLDPKRTMHELDTGLWIYHEYFVRKWTASLHRKQAAWPDAYDFRALESVRSLQHMTAELVARHTEYPQLDAYLAGYAITGDRLLTLEPPATIITAQDDPMIPTDDLERLAPRPNLRILVTRYGGHCGFLQDVTGPAWIEQAVVDELERDR